METITQRVRKDGSIGYTAQVRLEPRQRRRVQHGAPELGLLYRPAGMGYPVNEQAMADACKLLGKLGGISRSKRQ
jgi:hypothetical protein